MLQTIVSKAKNMDELRLRKSGYSLKFLPYYFFGVKKKTSPIYICGTQRSGTNMLANCFDNCRNIEVQHDISHRAYKAYRLRSDSDIEQIIRKSPGGHIVFKPLLDTVRAPLFLRNQTNSFVVWIYRNYIDVVLSMKKTFPNSREEIDEIMAGKCRSWRGEHFTENVIKSVRPLYRSNLRQDEALAISWLARNEFLFASHIDTNKRVIAVNYDQFLIAPEEQFKYLSTKIGFSCDKYATRHVRKPRAKITSIEISDEIKHACEEMMNKLNQL